MKYISILYFPLLIITFLPHTLLSQWHINSMQFGGGPFTSFAVAGTNLFASIDGGYDGTTGGVFVSNDNGINWTKSDQGISNDLILSLATSDTNIYANTRNGLFLSVNKGKDWIKVSSDTYHGDQIICQGKYIFASTNADGILRSSNNGRDWQPVNTGLPSNNIVCLVCSGDNIFIGTYDKGVFISTNSGDTWESVNIGYPLFDMVSLYSKGEQILLACSQTIFHSSDKGNSWSKLNIPFSPGYYTSFASNDSTLFVSAYQGYIYFSTDNGSSWKLFTFGLPVVSTWNQKIIVVGNQIIAGNNHGDLWMRNISEITSVNKSHSKFSDKYLLSQNYPNPFNSTATIVFNLPFKKFVSLKVFDALGREVSKLVFEELSAGVYSTQWIASNNPSGIYYYCLQTDNYSETKKLLLIK